jgi:hypothetical protein
MKRFIPMSSLGLAFAAAVSCSAAADDGGIPGAYATQAGDRYADTSVPPPAVDESQTGDPDADNADEVGAQDETNDDGDGDDSDDSDDGGPEQ